MILLSGISLAQDCTIEQKEVWTGVEKFREVNQSNPLDFLQYFDESYLIWVYENEAPSKKDDVVKSFSYWTKKVKVQYYVIIRAKIWINGDFAYVHYLKL